MSQYQRLGTAPDKQGKRRFFSNHSAHPKLYRLVITIHAGWLQSHGVELRDHIFGGAQIAFGAGEAALHRFTGQRLDMCPPSLSSQLIGGCLRAALPEEVRQPS